MVMQGCCLKMNCNNCEKEIGEHIPYLVDFVHYEEDGWIEVYYHVTCIKQMIREGTILV